MHLPDFTPREGTSTPADDRPHTTISEPPRIRFRLRGEDRSFDLSRAEYLLGRSATCDLRLANREISREHANLRVTHEGLLVEDRGSKNGTWTDGERIDRALLSPGSEVAFGSTRLVLEEPRGGDASLALVLPRPEPRDSVYRQTETVFCPAPVETTSALSEWLRRCRRHPEAGLAFPESYLPGRSPAMRAVYRRLRKALRAESLPVLLLGASGSGKEQLVRTLHASSRRRDRPFVAINCAALPGDLLEAELFGIGKGVATGVEGRPGVFRSAHGGTLLLDEIGEMPLEAQAKLLRVLQEREVTSVGGQIHRVDVRVVAATNLDLEELVETRRFRRDLFFRLAGFTLRLPLLSQCRDDIPPLIEHFLRRFTAEAGVHVPGVTEEALRKLSQYDWPGNVRELEFETRRLIYEAGDGQAIHTEMLSPGIRQEDSPAASLDDTASRRVAAEPDSYNLTARVQELESRLIREAYDHSGGKLVEAAKLLGIHRNGLARKVKRLGIVL